MNETNKNYGNPTLESAPHSEIGHSFKRISWGAVFAGLLLAMVVQLTLSLLGFGIGMGTIDPVEETNPLAGLGTGSLIWWIVTMLVALFIGGWFAGRLAGQPRTFDCILHGLLTWSLFVLLTFYLLTTAIGGLISGVGRLVGKTVSLAGQGLSNATPQISNAIQGELDKQGIDLSDLKSEANKLLRQTGKAELQPKSLEAEAKSAGQDIKQESRQSAHNPQGMNQNLDDVIDQLFTRGGNILEEVDREAVVNVIMERTGKSQAEAGQMADNWIKKFEETKVQLKQKKEEVEAKARKTTDDVASAASKAGIFGFFGLMVGAIVAGLGGKLGKPKDLATINH